MAEEKTRYQEEDLFTKIYPPAAMDDFYIEPEIDDMFKVVLEYKGDISKLPFNISEYPIGVVPKIGWVYRSTNVIYIGSEKYNPGTKFIIINIDEEDGTIKWDTFGGGPVQAAGDLIWNEL